MQSVALSLRDTTLILKIENEIGRFWKRVEKSRDVDVLYFPVWQTLWWGQMLIASEQVDDAIFFWAYEDDELIGYGVGEVRSVWMGLFAVFFVGWPQFLEGDTDTINMLVEQIENFAMSRWFAFVLYESLEEITHNSLLPHTGQTKYLLEPTTRMLDLSQSTEALLADMKQKGRYNIKVAEKSDCVALRVDATSANIDVFYALLLETTQRDGFFSNQKSYYERLLAERNHPAEWLYFVVCSGKVVSAAILIVSGSTAIYYYGASSSQDRKLMAPYLLQWEMIQNSKKFGCRWYDFLGIAPEGEDVWHQLQGVTDFKSKFWGIIRNWPTKKIFVSHKKKFLLYRVLRAVKKLSKKYSSTNKKILQKTTSPYDAF